MKLKPITKATALPTRLERVISEYFNYSKNGTHRSLWVPFIMLSYIEAYAGITDEEALPPIHDIVDHSGNLFGYMVSLQPDTPNDFIFFIPRNTTDSVSDARFKIKALSNAIELCDDAYSFSLVFVNLDGMSPPTLTYDSCYITGIRQFIPIRSYGVLPIIAKYNLIQTFEACDPETLFLSFFKCILLRGFWLHADSTGRPATAAVSITTLELLFPSFVTESSSKEDTVRIIQKMLHVSDIKSLGVTSSRFSERISFLSINPMGELEDIMPKYLPLIWKD